MRTPILILVAMLGLVAASATHAEKKVYKCTNADGSLVFSPNPCGTGAQELHVDAGSAPSETPVGATNGAPAAAVAGTAPDGEAEDAKCKNDAQNLIVYPGEGNLQMMQQHQAELVRAYAAYANEATKIEIGNLDVGITAEQERIANERARVDRAYRAAIEKCDARTRERVRQAEEQAKENERERQAAEQAEQERQAAQRQKERESNDGP
jgi:hypothetical protein